MKALSFDFNSNFPGFRPRIAILAFDLDNQPYHTPAKPPSNSLHYLNHKHKSFVGEDGAALESPILTAEAPF